MKLLKEEKRQEAEGKLAENDRSGIDVSDIFPHSIWLQVYIQT